MANRLSWEDLAPELEGPERRDRRHERRRAGPCLIRLDAGLTTDPLFAGSLTTAASARARAVRTSDRAHAPAGTAWSRPRIQPATTRFQTRASSTRLAGRPRGV